MLGRWRSGTQGTYIGLDVGSHSLKAVELVRGTGEILLRGAESIPTPPGSVVDGVVTNKGAVAGAIRQLWKKAGFVDTQALLALDARCTQVRWHYLEVEADENLEEVARAAALRGIPYPPSEAVFDYRVLASRERRGRTQYHLVLFTARTTLINDLLDSVERAGVEPTGVDVQPLAISRAASLMARRGGALWNGQPEAHCIVGERSTQICILRDSAIEFARSIPVGSANLSDALAEQLQVSQAEAEELKLSEVARLNDTSHLRVIHDGHPVEVSCGNVMSRLIRELERSLRHFQSQFPEGSYKGMIGRVVLSGGGGLLRGMDTYLSDHISDEIQVLNPFAGFSVVGSRIGLERLQSKASSFSVAMGLALGQLEALSTREVKKAA